MILYLFYLLLTKGGGDCPEMSIGAIKIALEISLPGSFIYVFTDARSKDYRLTHEVLQLIQQKQSQVVFVLTGDCDDRSHIGYKVYEEIASTSSGQVFHLDKKQVNETSSSGRHSVRITGLSTIDFRAGFSRKPTLDFRKTISRPVQGIPTYVLLNTSGISIPARVDRLELLSISGSSLKTIPVKYHPDRKPYGIWNISDFIPPSEAFFLKVTGYDKDDYLFQRVSSVSFSSIVPDAPKVTMPRKIPGYYLQPGQISCSVESLLPYTLSFVRNGVTLGVDQYLNAVDYNVTWQRNDRDVRLAEPARVRALANLSLELRNVKFSDAGEYQCTVSSEGGSSAASVFLTVQEAPKMVVVQSELLVALGDTTVMECKTSGVPPPQVKWFKGDLELRPSTFLLIDPLLGLLKIQETQDLDAGDYTCVAFNDAGRATGKITLDVGYLWASDKGTYICEAENQFGKIQSQATITVTGLAAPLIGISPSVANVVEGQQLTLPCTLLAGNPIPERRWIKNAAMLVQNPYLTVRSDGSLHIERVRLQDGGQYTCVASNVAGTSNKTTSVVVHVLPTIQHGQQILSTIEGIPVTLPCKASGIPKPSIVWSKKGELISTSSAKFSAGADGSLYVVSPGGEESGEYICTASNAAGYAKRKVQLTVYVRPRVFGDQRGLSQEKPVEVSVLAGEEATLPCEVKSLPPPVITWAKETQLISPFSPRHMFLPSGSMKITETRISDSGMYLCVATNIAGNVTQLVKLSVHVPPKIQHGPKHLKVQVGQRVDIPCNAPGTPLPVITWYKDGSPVLTDGVQHLSDPDGTLSINQAMLSDAGTYTCVATNIAGRDETEITLHVQEPPTLEDPEPPYNTPFQERVANQRIAFPCPVKGTPIPTIKWLHNGRELTGKEPGVSILEDGSLLVIASVTPYDNGEYICVAINEAGTTERKYNLKVHVPPVIKDKEQVANVSVLVNQLTSLVCDVEGTPSPIITWYKDDVQVTESSTLQIVNSGKILKLFKVTPEDAGKYSCKAINIAGISQKYFIIDVQGASSPSDVSVVLGHDISLECQARGAPFPIINWFKDGKPLFLGDPNIELLDRGQILHLKNARRSDKGRYQCVVSNAAGKQAKDIKLTIYVPPVIEGDLATPSNKQVVVAHSLTLECKAAGNPPPVLTWLKDGVPVKANGNIRIEAGGKKLEIMSAQEVDRGQYACVATSVAGEKEIRYEVDVLVPPAVEGGDETSYFIVMVNNLLELDCQVTGSPTPTIMWMKDGQLIDEKDGFKILLNGRKLVIAQAQVSDTGLYRCVATNTAGDDKKEFEVTVHVPPTIKSSGLSERAVVKYKPITLQCIANGIPNPSITWLKDDQPVNTAQGNLKIQSSGRVLQIAKALLEDAGRYTCVATNAAGEAQQHIQLHVHEPPSLEDAGKMLNETVVLSNPVQLECKAAGNPPPVPPSISGSNNMVAVVVNNLVRLECEARGIPAPSLTWLKDGSPVSSFTNGIQVLSGGRILALTSAQISDTGRYTCVAVNAAGEKQRDIDLRVYVPPNIYGSDEFAQLTVIEGNLISLLCESSGIPPPNLIWKKKGSPVLVDSAGRVRILSGGRQLQISIAEKSDAGLYTCVASNVAGTAKKDYNLHVYIRPTITNNGSHSTEIIVTRGKSISLECEVQGVPHPTVTWMKDGRPLTKGRGVEVLDEGRTLQLRNVHVSDTGRYVCVAVNVAGDKKYDLSVHAPPSIIGNHGTPENISVVEKNSVSLACEASGIPLPSITWLKDGWPISLSNSVRILSGGRMLRLLQTRVEDAGWYTCIVRNEAGEERKIFRLSVLVPPRIVGENTLEDVKVKEKQSVTLACEVTGNPVPEITWHKDGQLLQEDEAHHITSGGRFLQITNAQVSHTGRYTCLASNIAGDKSKSFSLNVYVSPTIAGVDSDGSPEDVTVTLNSPTSLVCEAYSYPPATITWFKDGAPLESNRNIRILPGGRTLQILNAQEDNAGRYACVATNEAGEMIKHYEVKVYNDHVNIAANGRTLQIKETQISDTGRYTCVASNLVGEDELDFDVNIQVPPSFQKLWEIGNMLDTGRSGEAKDVVINNPISLLCETNAAPPPTLTWYKDGRPLTSSDRVLILPGGRVLQIPRAKVEDAGRYTCVAVNEAGEDSLQYDVRVLVPPVIKGANGDLPEEVTALVTQSTQMECVSSGSPAPRNSWQKDGQVLLEDDHHRFLSNGRILQILNVQITDIGRYACIAENTAGSAKKYFNLNVHVPPSIIGPNPENLTVVVNNFISLTCEVSGFPPPDLSWLKNEQPIKLNTNALIVPGGRTLQIIRAKVSDGGEYTCIAINQAGESKKKVSLTVYVPPSIKDHGGESLAVVNVREGSSVSLECESNAVPPPVITWYKNGRTITGSSHVDILADGQMLHIKKAEVSDTGQYVCRAINVAGRDDKNFHLNVYVPPSIEGPEQEAIVETISNPVTFACDTTGIPPPTITWVKNHKPIVPPTIRGKKEETEKLMTLVDTSINIECRATGTPPPQINWLKNGLPLPLSPHTRLLSAGQVIRVVRAQVSDVAVYTCVASNRAGVDSKHYSLQVLVPPNMDNAMGTEEIAVVKGSPTSMTCMTDGTPTPRVSWLRDGQPLRLDAHLTVGTQGMVLRLTKAETEDSGSYTCIASNEAGEVSKHFILKVLEPPHINGSEESGEISVIVNNLLELTCIASGIPAPKITWMKDGRPLPQRDQIQTLGGGEVLRIASAQVEDTGRYTCLASSPAGDDDKEYLVRVHVPPNIAGTDEPQDFTVLRNRQVTLECRSDAVPPPVITWLKNGERLQATPRVRILSGGRYLQINNAELSDTANYTCVASNIAGKTTREFILTVNVPPSIAPGPTNVTVTINVQTTLACEATGIPKPSINWRKNGHPLNVDQNQNSYRLLSSGSLVIISPSVDDTATYECTVTNDAGEDKRTVALTVQADEATDFLVTKQAPTVITCTASGVPFPSIHWTKNGIRLLPRGDGYRILSSGTIEIFATQLNHAGRYTCVARNAAGSAHRHVNLHVQEPPAIQPQPSELDVILNNPVLLPCDATGTPSPFITWQKEGINVMTSGKSHAVLPSGGLQISRAEREDAGSYMCVAQNPAGTALGKIKLNVQVPPVVSPHPKEHVVAVDKPITLPCEADGLPPPDITWHKDGRAIVESVRQRVLSSGALQIAFAQPQDVGRYTCTAANAAGSSSQSTTLTVHEDSGIYTCVATNAAGEDTHAVRLTVHVLPTFMELPGDVSLNTGEQLRLSCRATGIPLPKLTWTFNNNIIPAHFDGVNGHSELVIERVSKEDSGTYVCTAENSVGFVKAIGFVYVKEPPVFKGDYPSNWIEPLGGNAILDCEVKGDPAPTIQWSRKGVDIEISHRIQQLGNGSLAIYGTVNEDAGDYTCVATNEAGVVERSMSLTLQSPPIITLEPVETVTHAGSKVTLNCQATGEPRPTIAWSRQGHSIPWDERVRVLPNNSLYIAAAQKEDTSDYECVARNLMGSVLVRVPLIVQVDGSWSEWSPWEECTRSCGRGNRTRTRTCSNPLAQHGGRPCDGNAVEVIMCNIRPCPGGPQRARGSVIGNINDVEFGIAFLNATVTDSSNSDTKIIHARITNVPRRLGEILRMTHIARGLDSDGALLLDIVVSGYVLQLPSPAEVTVKDYTEDYIQTGPGQLYAYSTRLFTMDGISVPYTWNHTIVYDQARGRMPFLVETLHASSVESDYNQLEETLGFKIHASISKGERSNQCPSGFALDSIGPFCADEDECSSGNPCSHTCHNAMGTYYCSCPKGLTIAADGRTCQDIDECALEGHTCHAAQDCDNTIGSYRCVVRCAGGFRRTSDGLSCQDINECQESSPCHQRCFNVIGSFHCGCEPGYQLKGRKCMDVNECRQNVCRPDQHCKNTRGGYKCIDLCPNGMTKAENGTCIDIDECKDGTHQCRYNQICENTRGSHRCVCPRGYRSQGVGRPCMDIDECESRDTCQHECKNTFGSFQCVCPPGYQLMLNGKTCQDVDECLEQNVHCGPNRMCFNMRGSYRCIDTPCPPNYQRDPVSGFCLKNCPPNDLECALSPYALEYKLVSLPFGIAANQDLIRLVAYTQDGVMHPRTTFLMVDEEQTVPFALRDENLKGVVYTTRPLREPETYRMKVRALSYSANGTIEYQTTFIVYIAVSAYPY
ncbi:Hemicentin-1 [Tupaia chinensis]|uniref:Hemicentin-1 n=1 Tax=Tupaia chinensis TaxID=246437 RepID=L8Y5J4_TUPCH|nr:Hemicentin-1 [Tupaia chinensis]